MQKGGDRVRVVCSGVRLRAKPMCLSPRLCGAIVRLRNRREKNPPYESERRYPLERFPYLDKKDRT